MNHQVLNIEKRMFETCIGLHKMFLYSNRLVYKQLLASLEQDLGEYYAMTGIVHVLDKKLLDFYAKMWQINGSTKEK